MKIKINRITQTAIICLLFSLLACEVSDGDKTAKFITIKELSQITPGYEWFPYEFNKYQPDGTISKEIDSLWKIKKYNFVIFVNPSCNCQGTQVTFPMIVKCLKAGNIPDSSIIIYSMLRETYMHPYINKIHVNKLPSCFTVIDTSKSVYFSVVDTFEVYQLKYPGKYKMEHIIKFSLEK